MQTLTIQLTFNFNHTESGLRDAIELLEFTVHNHLPLASLRAYNQIFAAILHCRKNEILSLSVLSDLQSHLVAFHVDVLALNGVR